MDYYISKESKNGKYIRFSNSEDKYWIIPTNHKKVGLGLYQPSSLKAKIVKKIFPYIPLISMVRKKIKGVLLNLELRNDISKIISDATGYNDWNFSIFEGTPSVHKKPTIQIFRGNKILAYCKITGDKDISSLFRNEAEILNLLSNKGLSKIPKVLCCDTTSSSETIFIQSTTKTLKSKSVHSFTNRHWGFLDELHNATSIKCKLSDSDFGRSLDFLEDTMSNSDKLGSRVVLESIRRIKQYYGEEIHCFSAYHGDFTPWNTYTNDDELFVFDFEYYKDTYPPFLDFFHFISQVGIIVKNLSMEDFFEFYIKEKHKFKYKDVDIMYTQYLISILGFYLTITKGELPENDRSYLCWIDILHKLQNS